MTYPSFRTRNFDQALARVEQAIARDDIVIHGAASLYALFHAEKPVDLLEGYVGISKEVLSAVLRRSIVTE